MDEPEEELSNEEFTYAIFMDVLEHNENIKEFSVLVYNV